MDRETVKVPIDSFIKSYLPFVPSQEAIDLIKKNFALPSSGAFTTTSNGSQQVACLFLQKIAQYVSSIDNLIPGREHNEYHYRQVSSNTMKSEIDGSTNSLDACLMQGEESATPSTHNIAVVIEPNHRQAILANIQIMNDDIRRMFTYAIIIEADLVTLWYHSRSHSAVSEPFSVVKEPQLLLKVFILFLFASREELGYDPKVVHISKEQYVFRGIPNVKDRNVLETYKIVGTISKAGVNSFTGQMTRLFKVVKLNPITGKYGTKIYVLKDVWIDETEDPSSTKYFLSIENEYEGALTKPFAEGFYPIRLEDNSIETSASHANASLRTHVMDNAFRRSSVYDKFSQIDYTPKKQCRLVFNELCTTVGHLQTLGEVIDVLFQALIPLEMMLCAGWVHRDISSGNVLAYRKNLDNPKQPWSMVLGDLEYAKKYPPLKQLSSSSDFRVGTPYFMPIEIMMQRSLFDRNQENVVTKAIKKSNARKSHLEQVSPLDLGSSDSDDYDDYARFKEDTLSGPKNATTVTWNGIVHNFQHDWESIWWLILWTITSRVNDAPEDTKSYARQIFQNSVEASPRRQKVFMESIQPDLEEHLGPLASYFAGPMDHMRKAMYKQYVLCEMREELANVSSYTPVTVSFRSFFIDILEHKDKWSSTRLDMQDQYIELLDRKRPLPDDIDNNAVRDATSKRYKAKYYNSQGSSSGGDGSAK
ncbi:hypothetical protein JR316_0002614 [Psilocybe cubensis]|uniref:Fungal-type protein kinase domain-containing protein n=2 Tax=Psilocybe cubensis TaxID=181762 RepID=A0A8H8CQH5_PSICU|nr:hypothetical protein JR316_0002614 [Psilocybe cubensis]KAH9485701.1 hypothetical protein JR316_0002614 [Psilocybe cubensis]